MQQIFGTFMYVDSSVRSWQILYVNYVLQYVNGNAGNSNKYPKHMFCEDKNKISSFLHIILLNKDSLQQQFYFNDHIFCEQMMLS